MSEITDVQIISTVTGRGGSGVLATIFTNIGSFSATVAHPYSTPSSTQYDLSTDYTTIQDTLKESLCNLDPKNIADIDKVLETLSDLGSTISLAVSMACCRAGARHTGLPLYRYLNAGIVQFKTHSHCYRQRRDERNELQWLFSYIAVLYYTPDPPLQDSLSSSAQVSSADHVDTDRITYKKQKTELQQKDVNNAT